MRAREREEDIPLTTGRLLDSKFHVPNHHSPTNQRDTESATRESQFPPRDTERERERRLVNCEERDAGGRGDVDIILRMNFNVSYTQLHMIILSPGEERACGATTRTTEHKLGDKTGWFQDIGAQLAVIVEKPLRLKAKVLC